MAPSLTHRSVLVVGGSHQLPGPEPGTLSGAGTQPVMCNVQYTVQAAHVTQDKSFISKRTLVSPHGLRQKNINENGPFFPSSDFKLVRRST